MSAPEDWLAAGALAVIAVAGCVPPDLSGAPELGGLSGAACTSVPVTGLRAAPRAAAPPAVVAPCPEAPALRARAERLFRSGRLDRVTRLVAATAARCPAEAAASADLVATARRALRVLGADPEEALARGAVADRRGDAALARACFDAALVAFERIHGARAVVEEGRPDAEAWDPWGVRGGDPLAWQGGDHRALEVSGHEHNEPVKKVRFTSDGERLVVAGRKELTAVWSLARGAPESAVRPRASDRHSLWVMAISPDGQYVTNRADDVLEAYDTRRGVLAFRLSGHEKASEFSEALDEVAFSWGGGLVATGDELGTLRVFRVRDGALVRSMEANRGRLYGVAWSPDARFLASASRDEPAVRVREVASGRTHAVLRTENDEISHLVWSAGGRHLVAADLFDEIRVWDLATCEPTPITDRPPCHLYGDGSCGNDALFGLAIAPEGDRLLGAFDEDGVLVWDTRTGRRLQTIPLPRTDRAWEAAISDDGRLAAVGTLAGTFLFRLEPASASLRAPLAPLAYLALLTEGDGRDAYVLDLAGNTPGAWPRPTGYYDVFGAGAASLACRVGPRRLPLDVCEDRLRVRGLLAKRAAGVAIDWAEDTGAQPARALND